MIHQVVSSQNPQWKTCHTTRHEWNSERTVAPPNMNEIYEIPLCTGKHKRFPTRMKVPWFFVQSCHYPQQPSRSDWILAHVDLGKYFREPLKSSNVIYPLVISHSFWTWTINPFIVDLYTYCYSWGYPKGWTHRKYTEHHHHFKEVFINYINKSCVSLPEGNHDIHHSTIIEYP